MSQNALMEKPGEGQMFVPPGKVQAYLDAGWKVIQPADELLPVTPAPVAAETEPAEGETSISVDVKPVRRKSPKKS
jgi:hypothetical protein